MKVEKVVINGGSYYHYQHCENIADRCGRCCFLEKDGSNRHCELPFRCEAGGYYIHYNQKPIEIGGAKIYVDVPPPPEPDKADNDSRLKTMKKKLNYLVIDGVRYDPAELKNISTPCEGCCFLSVEGECTMPDTEGFTISCDDGSIFAKRGKVAAQQQPAPKPAKAPADNEPDEKEAARASSANVIVTDKDFMGTLKLDKPLGQGSVAKRSCYSFPNGMKAEDICRYLSFNLGNVVKYVCRVERMDGYKKIEDLEKARNYLDDEIERLKEEFGNEIQKMKDKIAKEKDDDD